MSSDEHTRHELHQRLVEAIGEEAASTLMSSLPPDRWDHLATKDDLGLLRLELDERLVATREILEARIEATKHELLAALHAEVGGALVAQTRVTIFTMAGTLLGLAGLAMAFAQLG
jgi:hypothetical protein